MKMHVILPKLVLTCVLVYADLPVKAAVDQGVAEHLPWSGYWWPSSKGEILGPLQKYDTLTRSRAYDWELRHHPPGQNVPEWHGYCHGWAAAAVLETEPLRPFTRQASYGPTVVGVADQKGWYAVSHSGDVANWYGERFGDGQGSEDYHDMAPDAVWRLLKMFLADWRVPLVMDLDAGPEVWNYPVYAYRVNHQPDPRGNGWHVGQLSLWAADDAVPPDFVGLIPHYQTYTFQFQMRGGSIVSGSGRWTGQSIQNHPDFAWYPYVVTSENPEVRYTTVKSLVGSSLASDPIGPPGTPAVSSANRVNAIPGGASPNVPGGASPNVPGGASPNIPGGASPNIPGAASPNVPGGASPNIPGGASANIPGGASANIPGFHSAGDGAASGVNSEAPIPLSPPQLVAAIANRSSHFGFDVRMSQFGKVRHRIGEKISISGTSEQPGFVYLLHVNPLGELRLLYPSPGSEQRIAAQSTFQLPARGEGRFEIQGPLGNHRIKAIVSKQRLILTGLDQRPARQRNLGDESTWRPRNFRLCSTQIRQIKSLLREHVEGKNLSASQLDNIDAARLIPGFSQDEITYYVGPSN